MNRKVFPRKGIYRCSGLSSSYYENDADEKRYRYVTPAYTDTSYADARRLWQSDCWIVDKAGEINPGTAACPVPINLDNIGRRVA